MKKFLLIFVLLGSLNAQTYHCLKAVYTPEKKDGYPDLFNMVTKTYDCYWIITPTKIINSFQNKADVYTIISHEDGIDGEGTRTYMVKAITGETLLIHLFDKYILIDFYEILVSRKNAPYQIKYIIND